MAEEQSLKDQIAAMESWSINIREFISFGNYDEAKKLLREINTQGRRLEWRGGKRGLKHLPEMSQIKVLKIKISQTRSASQEAQTSIEHFERVAKKEGKTPVEIAAIKRKETSYKNETRKNVSILIKELIGAKEISDAEPWFDPVVLVEKSNLKALFFLLRCEKFYAHFSEAFLAKIVKKINFKLVSFGKEHCTFFVDAQLQGLELQGVDFHNGFFRNSNLIGTNFSEADLSFAKFIGAANLMGANFTNANLALAEIKCSGGIKNSNFRGANLRGAVLSFSDFTGVILTGADINGANLYLVKNLSTEQLHSAKNWEKARSFSTAPIK